MAQCRLHHREDACRKNRLIAAATLIVLAGLGAAYWMWQPAIAPIATPPASDFARTASAAARVVAQGDCMVCHTSATGAPFAGGLPLRTPFGTIFTTNITPDAGTGIGNWSLAAFTRALRHGVARDGHLLYPAFPYVHYTRMSTADINDAYAYLMTRTPVRYQAPDNELPLPLRFRPMLAGWNLLYLRPGPEAPEPARAPSGTAAATWSMAPAIAPPATARSTRSAASAARPSAAAISMAGTPRP
jgi:mono/diheme cytochrome c family protein